MEQSSHYHDIFIYYRNRLVITIYNNNNKNDISSDRIGEMDVGDEVT